jgi:hypothetical protein
MYQIRNSKVPAVLFKKMILQAKKKKMFSELWRGTYGMGFLNAGGLPVGWVF